MSQVKEANGKRQGCRFAMAVMAAAILTIAGCKKAEEAKAPAEAPAAAQPSGAPPTAARAASTKKTRPVALEAPTSRAAALRRPLRPQLPQARSPTSW